MNKKAQMGVGMLITVAIAVIIGLIIFTSIAANVEQGTRTVTGTINVVNQTITFPAGNGTLELTGQELVGTYSIYNVSKLVTTANYTIAECVRTSNNLKGICLTSAGNILPEYAGRTANLSYSYYPDGYIDDAGARSITGIIILLVAIGLFVVVFAGNRLDF